MLRNHGDDERFDRIDRVAHSLQFFVVVHCLCIQELVRIVHMVMISPLKTCFDI